MATVATHCSIASAITLPLEVISAMVQNVQEAATAYRIGEVGGIIDGILLLIQQREAQRCRLQDAWVQLCSGLNPGLLGWLPLLQETAARNIQSLQGLQAELQEALLELQRLAVVLRGHAAQNAVVAQELQVCQNRGLAWGKGMLALLEREVARRALLITQDCSQVRMTPFSQVLEEVAFPGFVRKTENGVQGQAQLAYSSQGQLAYCLQGQQAAAHAWSASGGPGQQLHPTGASSSFLQPAQCPGRPQMLPDIMAVVQGLPALASQSHMACSIGPPFQFKPHLPLQQQRVGPGVTSPGSLGPTGGRTLDAQPGLQASARVVRQALPAMPGLPAQVTQVQPAHTAAHAPHGVPLVVLGTTTAASDQGDQRQLEPFIGTAPATALSTQPVGQLGPSSQAKLQHQNGEKSMLMQRSKTTSSPDTGRAQPPGSLFVGPVRGNAAQGLDGLPGGAVMPQSGTAGASGSRDPNPYQQPNQGVLNAAQHDPMDATEPNLQTSAAWGQQQGRQGVPGGPDRIDGADSRGSPVPLDAGQTGQAARLGDGHIQMHQQLGAQPAGNPSEACGVSVRNGIPAARVEQSAAQRQVLQEGSEEQRVRLTARSPAVRGDAAPSTSTEASLSPTHGSGNANKSSPPSKSAAPAFIPHLLSEAPWTITTPQSVSLGPLVAALGTAAVTQSPLAPEPIAPPALLFAFHSPAAAAVSATAVQPTPTLLLVDGQAVQPNSTSEQAAGGSALNHLHSQDGTVPDSAERMVSAIQSTPSPGTATAAFLLMTSQLDSNSPSKRSEQPGGVTKLGASQGGSQAARAQPLCFSQPEGRVRLEPPGSLPALLAAGPSQGSGSAQIGPKKLCHEDVDVSKLQQQAQPLSRSLQELMRDEHGAPADEQQLQPAQGALSPQAVKECLQPESSNGGRVSQGQGSQPAEGLGGPPPRLQHGEVRDQHSQEGGVAASQLLLEQQAMPNPGSRGLQSTAPQPMERPLALHGFSRLGRMQDRQAGLAARGPLQPSLPAAKNPGSNPAGAHTLLRASMHVSDTTAEEEGGSDPSPQRVSDTTAEVAISVTRSSTHPGSQPCSELGTQAVSQASQEHADRQTFYAAAKKRARPVSGITDALVAKGSQPRDKRARMVAEGEPALETLVAGQSGTVSATQAVQTQEESNRCKQQGRGLPSSVDNSSEEQELSLTPQVQPSLHPPPPAGGAAPVGQAALRWATPAIMGPARQRVADQPSPWNTPVIGPPTSASLMAEEGGSASQEGLLQSETCRKAWRGGCTQRIYGSLPTPIPTYLEPSPGVGCSRTEQADRRHSSQPGVRQLQSSMPGMAQAAAVPSQGEQVSQQSCSRAACKNDGQNETSQPSQQAVLQSLVDFPETHVYPESQLGSWPGLPAAMPLTQLTEGAEGALISASQ